MRVCAWCDWVSEVAAPAVQRDRQDRCAVGRRVVAAGLRRRTPATLRALVSITQSINQSVNQGLLSDPGDN